MNNVCNALYCLLSVLGSRGEMFKVKERESVGLSTANRRLVVMAIPRCRSRRMAWIRCRLAIRGMNACWSCVR